MPKAPCLVCHTVKIILKSGISLTRELWQEAAELMKNGNKEEMKYQVSTIAEFARDPEYTRYASLEKYDFIREAVHGK